MDSRHLYFLFQNRNRKHLYFNHALIRTIDGGVTKIEKIMNDELSEYLYRNVNIKFHEDGSISVVGNKVAAGYNYNGYNEYVGKRGEKIQDIYTVNEKVSWVDKPIKDLFKPLFGLHVKPGWYEYKDTNKEKIFHTNQYLIKEK